MTYRLPTQDDLKSDTVKASVCSAFATAIIALASMLSLMGLIPEDAVVKLTAASTPFALFANYLCAFFRVNQKTDL